MLKLIWNKLSGKERISLIVFSAMLGYIAYQSIRIAYKDHLLIKRVADDIENVTEKQEENTKKTDSFLSLGKKTNTKAVKKKKAIDKKLNDDKEIIDNSEYSTIKLDSLLSSYGN